MTVLKLAGIMNEQTEILELLETLHGALDHLDSLGATLAAAHLSACIDELHNKFKMDYPRSDPE